MTKAMDVKSTISNLRPIDDTFIRKLGENREFCQEMLRIILNMPDLMVISNTTQKNIHNIDTRSVTVDILCEDGVGSIFSVEVQKANNDDHQKRVRYNSSCVHIQALKKGNSFKLLPDIYMIYITEKDFLNRGKVIYHIDRVIRETGEILDNGYYEIYVNAEVSDDSDLAEYMKLFKSSNIKENDKFPYISKLTKYYKEGKGNENMCDVVEEYAREYAKEHAKEQAIETARVLIRVGNSDEVIIEATKLTKEEVSNLRKSLSQPS